MGEKERREWLAYLASLKEGDWVRLYGFNRSHCISSYAVAKPGEMQITFMCGLGCTEKNLETTPYRVYRERCKRCDKISAKKEEKHGK